MPLQTLSLTPTDPGLDQKQIPVGAWLFLLVRYDIQNIDDGTISYKLTRKGTAQTTSVEQFSGCSTTVAPLCQGDNLEFLHNDNTFWFNVQVRLVDGYTFSVKSYDGGARPLIRNFMSSMVTLHGAEEKVSDSAVAELMKGQVELPMTELSFVNLDFTALNPYLSSYTEDEIYASIGHAGIHVPKGRHIDLGDHDTFAVGSTDKFIKNFCWDFMIIGEDLPPQANPYTITTGLQFGEKTSSIFSHIEQIFLVFKIKPDPSSTPNEVEVFIKMWGSHPPNHIGTINPLDLAPGKHIEVTGCYSFLWVSKKDVYHSYVLKFLSNTSPQSTTNIQKSFVSHFKVQLAANPEVDPSTHRRSVRFEMTSDSPEASFNYKIYFKGFRVMNGGMLENKESSYPVKSRTGELGMIDHCLLEIDYESRQCLRCIWSRFYDSGTGKCEPCSSSIQGCRSCTSSSLCDSCVNYDNAFGTTSCLQDLNDCALPKYSRYSSTRCDSCEKQSPNFCKCGPSYKQVTSTLDANLKMCVCKIANCKYLILFILIFYEFIILIME